MRNKDKQRAYNKAYYKIHREAIRAHRIVHKEEINAKKRAYYRTHKEQERIYREAHRESIRNTRLQHDYGISLAEYNRMLSKQGGCCTICDRKVVLHVDHNHVTGKVRGLLCGKCNRALGLFQDSPKLLRRALAYAS
jgi:hypothetical protein